MSSIDSPRQSVSKIPSFNLPGFQFHELIGSGSYATVYRASRQNGCGNEFVAVKVINRSKLAKHDVDNLISEIKILKTFKHTNIVRMEDFQWDSMNVYIIMEYCEGRDLSLFIRKRQRLPERVCVSFLKQLANGLHYLRANNISHFDLKPKNLLLKMRPTVTLKIGDFGFAQCLSDETKLEAVKGSPLYMAPEMLLRRSCNAKVDLWSVGVIFYECLFGQPPLAPANTFDELVAKMADKTKIKINEEGLSRKTYSLLCGLLEYDAEQRMDFDVFFAHPLIDVAHEPTPRTYAHGVRLVGEAVQCDEQRKLDKAFDLYCDALAYLVPHLRAEHDPQRKAILKARLEQYMSRAEALLPVSKHKAVQHSSNLLTLKSLCKSTPAVADALDTMASAEMYLAEGNYVAASDKFESGLAVLIDALGKEPPGPRRDHLHLQVKEWLDQASRISALIEISENGRLSSEAEAVQSKDVARMCCLQ